MANERYAAITADAMTTASNAGTFIPELWSDEIIASYKSNLVLGNLVRKMSMKGKKGDRIHVPKPSRGDANVKTAGLSVTIIEDTNTELVIDIDRHFEYSKMIEDIASVQALSSLRRFYTEDAGYAMSKQLDTDLFRLGMTLDDGAITQDATVAANWVNGGGGTTTYTTGASGSLVTYNGTTAALDTFAAATMRAICQKLDDNDVPQTGRFFAVPPVLINKMRSVSEFISNDFVNGKPTETGKIGDLYGVPVYVSTNVPSVTVTGNPERMTLLAHKDSYICAEQVGVRSQTQYKQEYLATLLTSDRIYGVKVYREESVIVLAVDAG